MKLQRLVINRLPGISQPFEISAAGAGFHVIRGPNGVGKSSLCRAVEGLYWKDRGSSQRTSTSAQFEIDGEAFWVEREGAQVRWQREGETSSPPSLPGSHNHHCFFLSLRDLIDPSPEGTQDIASEIRRQMSGGFDLEQLAIDLFGNVGAQHGRRERRNLNKAAQDVQVAEGEQSGLQKRADQLASLTDQLGAAEESGQRITAVERALDLANRLEQHAAVATDLAALPAGIEKLTGGESKRIEELEVRAEDLRQRIRDSEDERDAARQMIRDARLAEPLGKATLKVWQEIANELSRLSVALQASKVECSECQRKLVSALAALGGGNVDDVDLDLSSNTQLYEFLRAAEAHRTQIEAIEERLRLLAGVEQPVASREDVENSRAAAELLRAWLRAPAPENFLNSDKARMLWLVFALIAFAIGIGLALLVDPMFAVLAAAGAGVALPAALLRGPRVSSSPRSSAQAGFAKAAMTPPDAWDVPSVELLLRKLESDVANLDSRLQRARDRGVERLQFENRLSGLAEVEEAIAARRRQIAETLKLKAIPPDAELVDFARALDQYRSARIEHEGATGRVNDLETRYTHLLSELATELERNGELRPLDASTASAYLDNLDERNDALLRAIDDEKRAIGQLERDIGDRDSTLESVKKIYAELSLDDRDSPGLATMLNSLARYRDLTDAQARLDSQIAADRDSLAKAGEESLAELDKPALERLKDELLQSATKATGLRNEIADINAEVNRARRGASMEGFIAARDKSRIELQDRLDEALLARAGRLLIDGVAKEYERTQMPRVYERARAHFSAFTHFGYDLRLSGDAKAPRLFAIETSTGEGRQLAELSDGARAQLLLAARISFAEEIEQGRTLPLFLDEALDQSDPTRFEAIVRSLGRVASEQQRQIFYLSSDPLDTDRIRHALDKDGLRIATEIDLGVVRKLAASVSEPLALRVEAEPMIAAPGDLAAEDYGIALGVPGFAPGLGHAQQHFFYVLSDDLNLLHDLLVRGIERVGQWRMVSASALVESLTTRTVPPSEISLRVDLLEVFCEFWKRGRGRPIDRDVLVDSGALTERYLDVVERIAKEEHGDPARLIDILTNSRDPRLRGFRRGNVPVLEQYLRDTGYLDDQVMLSSEELRILAMATPAASNLSPGVANACLSRWWSWAVKSTGEASK